MRAASLAARKRRGTQRARPEIQLQSARWPKYWHHPSHKISGVSSCCGWLHAQFACTTMASNTYKLRWTTCLMFQALAAGVERRPIAP